MRKTNQEITDKTILEDILKQEKICRLGMIDNDLPYILPFNYGYKDNVIYIHCALEGRKIDILKANPKVCFEIEHAAKVVKHDKACNWDAIYRSIVGYGTVEFISNFEEKKKGLEILMAHFGAPDQIEFIPKKVEAIYLIKIEIETMTGKQSSNWDKLHAE